MTIPEDEKKPVVGKKLEGISGAIECIEAGLQQLVQYDKAGDIMLGPEIFDLRHAIELLTPPPVDGDLAEAIAYLRLAVFDTKKAFDSLEIIIQAATRQQAREWTSEELVDIGRKAIHEARNANNGYAPLGERALAGAVVKALAAKNIIRLKDGGGE